MELIIAKLGSYIIVFFLICLSLCMLMLGPMMIAELFSEFKHWLKGFRDRQ